MVYEEQETTFGLFSLPIPIAMKVKSRLDSVFPKKSYKNGMIYAACR